MKKKNVQELHTKTADELLKMADEIKHDVIRMQVDKSQKSIKNINLMYTKMKDRARLLTIAHEKKMKGEVKEVAEIK